jgi:CheY-like chemotaxis protein
LAVKNNGVILLVEDDPNDVALIKLGFSKVGISNPLVVISDGEKAIEYLSGQEPYACRLGLIAFFRLRNIMRLF